ncbi:hypothetical protein QAD02_021018 [Eretmocerus hayati]|uniref:Uncharacterized protein n=1 Tax=Eretmocerus hayati TaxID=131215 RepID=A0ACC2PNP2_9HYME|nr:hypothetical protein QAD02_021018 [Eretmocerus hayati]
MYHRSVLRHKRDIELLSRASSWLLFSCSIRELPCCHRRFFPSNRLAILAAGGVVRRRDMEYLTLLNSLMEDYREMQLLTSLLDSSETSTSEILGSDSDGTDCDIAGVISSPSTLEDSDQEETDSRQANFTIDIADEAEEETTNPAVDERVRPVRLSASPRGKTTPPSESPAVNRESPSLLSPISQHFPRRRGCVDNVYLPSLPISAADPDENDVGILRSRPSGRLATVLARDFWEPAADARNAIGQRDAAWNAIGQRDAAWPESLSVRNEGIQGGNGLTTGESSGNSNAGVGNSSVLEEQAAENVAVAVVERSDRVQLCKLGAQAKGIQTQKSQAVLTFTSCKTACQQRLQAYHSPTKIPIFKLSAQARRTSHRTSLLFLRRSLTS